MQQIEDSLLTVFIGIYNGTNYLDSLKGQLLDQKAGNFPIVIVDNFSTDDSWVQLQSWKDVFGSRLKLIRNDSNLGAGGSLKKTIESGEISTEWFTAIHQDDFYMPDHISTLREAIENAGSHVIGICTSMSAMDNTGKLIPTPPRAAWLVTNESQIHSFLINLRTQTLSWPSTAFRTQEFRLCFQYVHSPSFSDTETTLRLCAYGEFRYLRRETMRYRENPQSESHVVNSFESKIGAALGIVRVVSSDEFRVICRLASEDREKFFLELLSSITVRLGDSALCEFVKILAIEECTQNWNFENFESSQLLAEVYSTLKSEFTSALISDRIAIEVPESNTKLERMLKEFAGIASVELFAQASRSQRSQLLSRALSKLPLPLKAFSFKIYVRTRAIKNPDYYWNVYWK